MSTQRPETNKPKTKGKPQSPAEKKSETTILSPEELHNFRRINQPLASTRYRSEWHRGGQTHPWWLSGAGRASSSRSSHAREQPARYP